MGRTSAFAGISRGAAVSAALFSSALAGLVALIFAVGAVRGVGLPRFLLAPEIIVAVLGSSIAAVLILHGLRRFRLLSLIAAAPAVAFAVFSLWVLAGSWLTT